MTYDYELFFGNQSGTAEKCILEPTSDLRELANAFGAKLTFFIDVGYLKKLQEFQSQFPVLKETLNTITLQIKQLVNDGHACELHVHPHWEDTYYEDGKWKMVTSRYKLSDFDRDNAVEIVSSYYHILAKITGINPTCYRAGGWCLQPFSPLAKVFSELGLTLDSTVFRDGYYNKGNYFYDFRKAPKKEYWKFGNDICENDELSNRIELPIASQKYSSIFFWTLFIKGRLNPTIHKPIGDGFPMSSPGLRKEMLMKGKLQCTSTDGYFVTKIEKSITDYENKNWTNLVVIGHPKANTKFALKHLKKLLKKYHTTHSFVTLPNFAYETHTS